MRSLGAIGNSRSGVEVDVRLPAAWDVALAVTHILVGTPPADRQGGEEVEAHQAHSGDGDGCPRRQRDLEVIDRIRLKVANVGRVAHEFLVPRVP